MISLFQTFRGLKPDILLAYFNFSPCPLASVDVPIQTSPTNKTHLRSPDLKGPEAASVIVQKETITDSSQNSLQTHTFNTNNKEVKPAALMFSKPETTTNAKHGITNKMFSDATIPSRRPPETGLDPLSTFIMLRTQQRYPQSSVNTAGTMPLIWFLATLCAPAALDLGIYYIYKLYVFML